MAKNINKTKEKSLPEKFKQFFGFKGSTPLNFDNLKIDSFHLTPDVLVDISSENAIGNRLKAIKELYETVQMKLLEDNAVEYLFHHTTDLVQPNVHIETRHAVLQLYCFILQGQLGKMTIMRSVFFKFIKDHSIPQDASFRLEMLKTLSESGKTITHFEEEIGSFLLDCWPDMLLADKTAEFLALLVNIIKYNAAFLDDDIIAGYIKHVCSHCGSTRFEEDIKMCLEVMDAVLCYSHLPSSVLQTFIFALCLTVNVEKFVSDSWKVMKHLLGTNIGHTSIFTLCLFLQDLKNINQPGVMYGAVFFLSMALWGSKRVRTLVHPPSAVLPSIVMALKTNHHKVAFEVVLAVQRLVKQNDSVLETYTWDSILDIIDELLQYNELQKPGPPAGTLAVSVHDFITVTEENIAPYLKNRLYNIIESCSDKRSVESVIRLIKHRAENIRPVKEDLILHINGLLDKYFKTETRSEVQLYVLKTVTNIYMTKGYFQDDDAIEKTILHQLSHLENIEEISVRKAVITFLLQIAGNCMTELFFDFLSVIEKAMTQPFDILNNEKEFPNACNIDGIFSDVVEAISGLINVFEIKLHMLPSSHCAKAYEILVQHIQSHYDSFLTYYENSIQVRKKILEFFFKIRSNSKKQVGLIVDGKIDCCVYVLCNTNEANEVISTNLSPCVGSPPHTSSLTCSYISFEGMFQIIISSLKKEKDWTILDMVLHHLPCLLQNKALVICGNFNINALCNSLSTMLSETGGYPETLENAPTNITRTEFQSSVFPVIASLPAYHNQMQSFIPRILVRCLQSGLVSRSAKVCIEGLTLCTLEMQNIMIKCLPAVLEKLAKISATVAVSISVLEFLSNLIRLPQLYVSFVEDQYRSIFAIALPYTNPFKFSQFTVALAHHVIAMWFLKCRIPFRKEFAKFITKGLQNNMKIPYKKELVENDAETEDAVKNQAEESSSSVVNSMIDLHSDLFEIGLDFMARFTFGMSSNVPKRSSVAEFLLEKGQKNSWMIGNKIITITTSGCGSKAFKHGLCEKCYASCGEIGENIKSDENRPQFSTSTPDPCEKWDPVRKSCPSERRRHVSSFHSRNISLSELETTRHAKDDILLHKQALNPKKRLERRNTSYSPKEAFDYEIPLQETVSDKTEKKDENNPLCSCWCSGWAEIFIRRPTGNCSWMMKIQNKLFLPTSPLDLSLSAVSSLMLPVKAEISKEIPCDKIPEKFEESSEGNSNDFEPYEEVDDSSVRETSEAISCPETNVPIRRSNSSPDMNSGWTNFENFKATQNSHSFITEEFKHGDFQKQVDFKIVSDVKSLTLVDPPASESTDKSVLNMSNVKPTTIDNKPESTSNFTMGFFRDRGHTISVMSPNRASGISTQYQEGKDMYRSGMNPSFVFLSLYHNNFFGPVEFHPIQLRPTEANVRALKVLDHIHPYDTHKIGVVYVGTGQAGNEVEILGNQYGSLRYINFIRHLGNIVRLSDVDHEFTYVGGLDTKGADGKFALVWHDDVMRVAFHVATLMPNKQSDQKKNNKKMHIGNDFVTIVYNESGEDYDIGTIKSHVTTACVVIQPEDYSSNVVKFKLKTKELLEIFAHCGAYIVSDRSLPIFVRQMALHVNLAALILDRRQQSAHVSNWLERLRTIKRLRKKVIEELVLKEDNKQTSKSNIFVDNFTNYV